ncbi:hypothetical protein HMPREF9554_01930 [Treponema phagedenis F0421]|nr:hypothetical protein HMPREF9554_01930 [Treponema phagedenis F0421]
MRKSIGKAIFLVNKPKQEHKNKILHVWAGSRYLKSKTFIFGV